MTDYLMDSPFEGLRLEEKTNADFTRKMLEAVGLGAGMRVLDAGAGTGAVARVMSEVVGPQGSVVALELSESRIEMGQTLAHNIPNMEFCCADIYRSGLPSEEFDLIWSRFVFEYMSDPQLALNELTKLAKPGGKIVLADLDGNTLFHYPMPIKLKTDLDTIIESLQGRFDPYVGRKLFGFARAAGLDDIRVSVLPYDVFAGRTSEANLKNWSKKLETIESLGAEALGGTERYRSFMKDFLHTLASPDTFYYSVMIVVEAVRPF